MALTIRSSHKRSTSVTKSFGAFSVTSPGFRRRESWRSAALRATLQTNAWRSCAVSRRMFLVEVLAEVLGTALLAQQVQGFHLDLAHPLACDVELAADLLQGPRTRSEEHTSELQS